MGSNRLKVRRIIERDGYAEASRESGVSYRSLRRYVSGVSVRNVTEARIDAWLEGIKLPKRVTEEEIHRWGRRIGTGRLARRSGVEARLIHQWLFYRKEMPPEMRVEYAKGPHKVGRKTR